MSGASALSSFEYIARLAGAKTGLEVIEISGAHYRNQLNVLATTPTISSTRLQDAKYVAGPFRTRGVVASCVVLYE